MGAFIVPNAGLLFKIKNFLRMNFQVFQAFDLSCVMIAAVNGKNLSGNVH